MARSGIKEDLDCGRIRAWRAKWWTTGGEEGRENEVPKENVLLFFPFGLERGQVKSCLAMAVSGLEEGINTGSSFPYRVRNSALPLHYSNLITVQLRQQLQAVVVTMGGFGGGCSQIEKSFRALTGALRLERDIYMMTMPWP
ncbi:hypothetical protein PAAG_12327 [Paracoccidioides lutzii Pb01]|uniref:Uncharacterized protein n=1 Tax=Paracoccidioides lutzii (strain ATCC MYA-826 / Pb01) TaxID=502779 RepID=A0A0A2V4D4_PARBA|nr:hypothetical protein PAAG_12327 [Paracoccidioides lutzii Pb01]KGQ01015.1 hypothetical protein PAAG_12327 [Paracoccidioides lutzii Pb01]